MDLQIMWQQAKSQTSNKIESLNKVYSFVNKTFLN